MERIYKYPLSLASGVQSVTLPEGAKVIHFGIQGDVPCIWARVDPFATAQQTRYFWALGTGSDVKDNLKHIGTVLHGAYVWHLFEVKQ